MRIVEKEEGIFVKKPDGTSINYFLFDEYELHANEMEPGTSQEWHHHEKIWETLFLIDGELTIKWKVDDEEKSRTVTTGDCVEFENSPHSISNSTDRLVKFLVVKQILRRENHREIFKSDKVVDQ